MRVSMSGDVRLELAERARLFLLSLLFLGRDLALAAEVVLRGCRRRNRRRGFGGRRGRCRGRRDGAADFGAAAAVGAAACVPSVTRS